MLVAFISLRWCACGGVLVACNLWWRARGLQSSVVCLWLATFGGVLVACSLRWYACGLHPLVVCSWLATFGCRPRAHVLLAVCVINNKAHNVLLRWSGEGSCVCINTDGTKIEHTTCRTEQTLCQNQACAKHTLCQIHPLPNRNQTHPVPNTSLCQTHPVPNTTCAKPNTPCAKHKPVLNTSLCQTHPVPNRTPCAKHEPVPNTSCAKHTLYQTQTKHALCQTEHTLCQTEHTLCQTQVCAKHVPVTHGIFCDAFM